MNVLIILGHPRTDSFCGALARAYRDGAIEAGVDVREIAVTELEFEPDVYTDSPDQQYMEDDLVDAQEHIRWADHLVFVYPNWWGTMPALLKGFFDRVFTPGFAFSFHEDGGGHRELLNDKTAELIVTMDMPAWVYRWIYRQPGNNAVKRATLGFAGIRTTRITNLGSVKESTASRRDAWLDRATRLGRSLSHGPEPRTTRIRRRLTTWLKALRLQFYPMSGVAYTVGALAATGSSGVFTSIAYWIGFLFLFFLEAATVLSNEYFDYETDRENTFASPFTGGSRVLVEGELGFEQLRAAIRNALVLTGVFGVTAVAVGAGTIPTTIVVLAVLAVLALGYTIPPLKLSYRSLGELDVAVTHSIGSMLCGFVVLGGTWHDPLPWLLSLPFLLAILPAITLAAVPDYAADRAAGKETLAVRFGIDRAVLVAAAATLLAALTGVLWQAFDVVPGVYGPLVYPSVLHALGLVWLLHTRLQEPTPQRIDGLMVASLSYMFWFGLVPLIGLL